MTAKVVAFSNEKGGVGKTALSVQFSFELEQRQKRVLFIDLDSSGDATKCICGGQKKIPLSILEGSSERGVSNTLKLFRESTDHSEFTPFELSEYLHLYGATDELFNLQQADIELAYDFSDSVKILSENYDYIIIDCPPTIGLPLTAAFFAMDTGGVVIPSNAESLSHDAALRLVGRAERLNGRVPTNISVLGIVHNKIKNPPTNAMKHFMDEMKETHGNLVLNTSVNISNRITDSISLSEKVDSFATSKADKKAISQIRNLTDEIIERLEPVE